MATSITPADTESMSATLRSEIEGLLRPALEASTLPPEAYRSPELYALEVEHIFSKQWIGVGRLEDIPEPGDFFTQEIAGESIIVVRDHDGGIRSHVNVCRHRGCRLTDDSTGHTTAFKCPYHGWLYQLDGELRGAPDFGDTKNFAKQDFPLISVQVEIWEGFIMVNLDPEAAPFRDQVRDVVKFGADKYGMADHVTTHRWRWSLDCNWKVYVENYIEEYHLPWVHGETFQPVTPMKGWAEYPDLSDEPWALMVGLFPGFSYSDTGEAAFRVAPETAELPPEYSGMPIWVMYPGFGILNSVDATLYYMMLPTGPETMELSVRLCVHRESAEKIAAGDPDAVAADAEYARNVEAFVEEDNVISAQQQRGLSSRMAKAGRFCKHEQLAWKFDKWVAETAYLRGPAA